MAVKRRTGFPIDERLLQRAQKVLGASTEEETVIRALQEVVSNKEVEAAVIKLIRQGRGRFVDVYEGLR